MEELLHATAQEQDVLIDAAEAQGMPALLGAAARAVLGDEIISEAQHPASVSPHLSLIMPAPI